MNKKKTQIWMSLSIDENPQPQSLLINLFHRYSRFYIIVCQKTNIFNGYTYTVLIPNTQKGTYSSPQIYIYCPNLFCKKFKKITQLIQDESYLNPLGAELEVNRSAAECNHSIFVLRRLV